MIETTAWTAALVLLTGVGVVVSGAITSKTVYGETPVVSIPQTRLVAQQPAVPQQRVVKVTTKAHTGVPVEQSLGPPPGPIADVKPTAFAAPEDRYAFLAGVTNYRKPTHDTIAGAQDVQFIRSLLLASGWQAQNIRMVTNSEATGAAVRQGIQWLASVSKPGTFTFFHFSGHVKQEGGHEKLWPYDRDFVPDTFVASTLLQGTGKLWVDIAGCEGGGFIENLPSSRVLVSTSSESTQKSYEFPQWGESVWSGLVYDLGLAQGQADLDKNGVTTVGEALVWGQYYAQAITLRQTPHGRQTPQIAGDPVRGWTLENPPA
ncbi:MAG: hypothetical protein JWO22_3628 [Frankiales bacterium]|nr:hypothetical protein [Frankiales bacterium]